MMKYVEFPGKVIIHVGPHKTGTTSIQKFLAANYDNLLDRQVLYPESGRKNNKIAAMHHPLVGALMNDDQEAISQFIEALEKEISESKPSVLIISSEMLSRENIDIGVISSIKYLFPKAKIEWLIYVRRQDRLLLSRYAEGVKVGIIKFPERIDAYNKSVYLDHRSRIERLSAVIGSDPITVVSFDETKNKLVRGFLAACRIDVTGLDVVEMHENPSMPWLGLRVMWLANWLPRLGGRKLFRKTTSLSFRVFGGLLPQKIRDIGAPADQPALDRVLKSYQESNDWVQQKFFEGRTVLTVDEDIPERHGSGSG